MTAAPRPTPRDHLGHALPLAPPHVLTSAPPPGKVLAALDREHLTNQTLVYFTSDNGGRLEAQEGGARAGGWNGVYRGE